MSLGTLNVLTTATPRPELHELSLFYALKSLRRTSFDIHWFVNVDCPSMFSENARKETSEKIKDFSHRNNIKLSIFDQHENSHFGKAGQRLFSECNKQITKDKNIFMWLEDDWTPVHFKVSLFLQHVQRFLQSPQDFIFTTSHPYVTGNPIVFKRPFFDTVCKLYTENEDPETLFLQASSELYDIKDPRLDFDLKRSVFYVCPLFCDLGTAWRLSKSITKLSKYKAKEHDVTWVSELT